MDQNVDDFECKSGDALDQVFYCWSLGKQAKNVYRYGTKVDCAKYWEKFRLCSGIKIMTEDSKRKAIKSYLDKKNSEKLAQPNLLDIWKERETKLEDFPPTKDSI